MDLRDLLDDLAVAFVQLLGQGHQAFLIKTFNDRSAGNQIHLILADPDLFTVVDDQYIQTVFRCIADDLFFFHADLYQSSFKPLNFDIFDQFVFLYLLSDLKRHHQKILRFFRQAAHLNDVFILQIDVAVHADPIDIGNAA